MPGSLSALKEATPVAQHDCASFEKHLDLQVGILEAF